MATEYAKDRRLIKNVWEEGGQGPLYAVEHGWVCDNDEDLADTYDPSPMCQMFVRTCSHLLFRTAELVPDSNMSPSSPCRELLPSVETVVGSKFLFRCQPLPSWPQRPGAARQHAFLGTAYDSNWIMLGLCFGFYLLPGSLWPQSCWTFTTGWVLS